MKRLIINNDQLRSSGPGPLSMPEPSVISGGQSFSLPTVAAIAPRIQQSLQSTLITEDFMTQKLTISSDQIKAGYTTPLVALAAPGAGIINVPIAFTLRMNFGTAAYATNVVLQARYEGIATNFITSTIIGSTESTITRQSPNGSLSFLTATSDPVNKAIIVDFASGNPTTGDGTLDIYITYAVVTL